MAENYFWQLFDIIWLIFLVSQINTILPLQIYSHKMYTPKRLVPRIRVTKFILGKEQLDHFLLNIGMKETSSLRKKINLLCIHIWPSLPSLVSLQSPWMETDPFITPFVSTDRLFFLIGLPICIMCTPPCY